MGDAVSAFNRLERILNIRVGFHDITAFEVLNATAGNPAMDLNGGDISRRGGGRSRPTTLEALSGEVLDHINIGQERLARSLHGSQMGAHVR